MPLGLPTYMRLDELQALQDVQLYTMQGETVSFKAEGPLSFTPSAMTGYRGRLVSSDGSSCSWLIQDSTPILLVGQNTFVFPKDVAKQLYYIILLPDDNPRQLEAFLLSLEDFCTIFQSEQAELCGEEWAAQLKVLTNSAQYSSRVARGISNAGEQISRQLGNLRNDLMAKLINTQHMAKEKLVQEQLAVDKDAKNAAAGVVAVTGVAKNIVQGALQLIAIPVKHGVKAGVKQGKIVAKSIQEDRQKQTWGEPTGPNATQEVFVALKGAVGQVVGAAMLNGKAVAIKGNDVLSDVVTHRFGSDVADVGNEGVKAVVTVVQTVAAVKTFGAVGLTRMTVEESVKALIADEIGLEGKAGTPVASVKVRMTVRSRQTVRVMIREDTRIVLLRLGVVRTLIPPAVLQGWAASKERDSKGDSTEASAKSGKSESGMQPSATSAGSPVKVFIIPLREWVVGEGGYNPPERPPQRMPSFANIVDGIAKDLELLQQPVTAQAQGSRPPSRGSQRSFKGSLRSSRGASPEPLSRSSSFSRSSTYAAASTTGFGSIAADISGTIMQNGPGAEMEEGYQSDRVYMSAISGSNRTHNASQLQRGTVAKVGNQGGTAPRKQGFAHDFDSWMTKRLDTRAAHM